MPGHHRSVALAAASLFAAAEAGAQEAATRQDPVELAPIVVDWSALSPADRADDVELDAEDLERRNPHDLRDAFQGEASVSVGGAIGPSQKLYVNGIEETNLAVSVDGAPQNRKIFHHAGTNLIDPRLLKAVRVAPGVAPADAGFGALGGSVEFETVDAADLLEPGRDWGAEVVSSIDSNGTTVSNSLSLYGRHGGFEGLGFVRYAHGDEYGAGGGGEVPGTGTNVGSLLIKGAWESETGHRFELSAERVMDDAARPFRANIGALPGRPDPLVRDYQLSRSNYVFRYETTRDMGLFDPRVVVSWTESETEVPVPYGSVGEAGGISARVENRFALTENDSITAGVDFRQDRGAYSDPVTAEIEEESINFGAYAQARLEPVERLALSFGVRGDRQTFTGVDGSEHDETGLSGNASARWQATDFLALNAGISDVFGGIALNEPYIFNPGWTYSDLEAVRARNYVLGAEVAHAGFTAGAGYFRTEFSDARDANYTAGPFQAFDFRSEGWKANAGYAWDSGFVRATFVDADVTDDDGRPVTSDALTYFGAPLGRVIALEAMHAFEGTGVSVGGSFEAALENDDLESLGFQKLEGYQVANAYIEFTPPRAQHFTFRAEVRNIFDEEYSDRTTYGQEYGTVEPLREQGRSFMFTARLRF